MPANKPLEPRGWHGRGYLPHFDGGHEVPQFVTFRLADSVPRVRLNRWQDELRDRPEPERELELYRLVESFLDAGHGACHLREPQIARLVEEALLHFDGRRYEMHAWAIMPNHVHTLFTPIRGRPLSGILWSWKSFTSKQANELLGLDGQFWQEDYFDRYIRDANHFADAVAYIERNPVKAGLCRAPEGWAFGSARLRLLNIEAEAGQRPALQKGTHEPA
ncbi:transposase [Gemmata sp. JC717]|uniref:transposase n=1 Tax=Gemmata algarum TaxID=2975278 RepID=UPI0021BBB372|nr:transposase [Gemmata algarum]MDY3557311.1 transposase [Gemmata algarum]